MGKLKSKKPAKKTTVAKKSKPAPAKARAKKSVPPAPPRKTIVSFVLDETGSMSSCKAATITGFNEYVKTLKAKGGNVLFTLTKFNSARTVIVHSGTTLDNVADLTDENYRPDNGTPLYDAVGKTILSIDGELANVTASNGKPAVLVVIMTDGEENSSSEFTRDRVRALIGEREKQGWDFVYLGADHDAFAVAASIGVAVGNTVRYSTVNTGATLAAVAQSNAVYTSNVSTGRRILRRSLITAGVRAVMESTTKLDDSTVKDLLSQGTK